MAKIAVKAKYSAKPHLGMIRLTQMLGDIPYGYSLTLLNEKTGIITTRLSEFGDLEKAIAHATLYGFNSQTWEKEFEEI